jgi:glycosyltransferase involved in cell wall biosynthesis
MDYTTSLVITTFQRANLLEWGLLSLAKQNIPFPLETIIVNDGINDETEAICRQYSAKLNLKYIFSGQRNIGGQVKWRVPGFAFNIGVRQSEGRILILSCAEMFHIGDTIHQLISPILQNNTLITVPVGKDDQDASFLNMLIQTQGNADLQVFNNLVNLNVQLPFLIAIDRIHFMAIRGYDEDFTGIAFDDNDLVDRLQKYGCRFFQTQAKAVHLYHPRYVYQVGESPDWHYNRNLYLARKNNIVRNINRDWGKI